jgi:hypothetical protein
VVKIQHFLVANQDRGKLIKNRTIVAFLYRITEDFDIKCGSCGTRINDVGYGNVSATPLISDLINLVAPGQFYVKYVIGFVYDDGRWNDDTFIFIRYSLNIDWV